MHPKTIIIERDRSALLKGVFVVAGLTALYFFLGWQATDHTNSFGGFSFKPRSPLATGSPYAILFMLPASLLKFIFYGVGTFLGLAVIFNLTLLFRKSPYTILGSHYILLGGISGMRETSWANVESIQAKCVHSKQLPNVKMSYIAIRFDKTIGRHLIGTKLSIFLRPRSHIFSPRDVLFLCYKMRPDLCQNLYQQACDAGFIASESFRPVKAVPVA